MIVEFCIHLEPGRCFYTVILPSGQILLAYLRATRMLFVQSAPQYGQ